MIWLIVGFGFLLMANILFYIGLVGTQEEVSRLGEVIHDLKVAYQELRHVAVETSKRLTEETISLRQKMRMLYLYLGVEEKHEAPKEGRDYLVKVKSGK